MTRSIQKYTLALLLIFSGLQAEDLRVNVVNGTTNSPGKADVVKVIDISTGMAELASASNVNGSTTFSNIQPSTRYLLQAILGGVTYSSVYSPPAGAPAWETSLSVFDTKSDESDLHVTVPYFVIYAFEDKLYIQKRIIFENHSNPPVTIAKSPGVAKVFIPDNISEMDYLTFKTTNMPLNTGVVDSDEGQVIPNALKPGASEVDVAYYLPYENNNTLLTELINYDIEHFHVYTMPISLNISAPGLSREGTDDENGLGIYALNGVKAGTKLDIQVVGQGMSEDQPQQTQSSSNSGRILIEHRIPNATKLVLSAVLILGMIISLFVSVVQQSDDMKQESIKMLKQQKKALLRKYSNASATKADAAVQDKILHQLLSVYKTLDRIK